MSYETDAGDYKIGTGELPPSQQAHAKTPAAPTTIDFSIPAKLEPFVLLAKSARGASAANLIGQATGAPGVHVFSELLALPGIKDLANNEQYASSYQLLEIFAYGVWGDYASKRDILPKITTAQEKKLKQLTILSLAAENQVIPYSVLLSTLDLPSVPVLEDLLIDAFYSNILTGRLDQKDANLEVIHGIGRDVRPSAPVTSAPAPPAAAEEEAMDLDAVPQASTSGTWSGHTGHSVASLSQSLTSWLSTIGGLLHSLDTQIGQLAESDREAAEAQAVHDKEVQAVLHDVSNAKEKEHDRKGQAGSRSAAAGLEGGSGAWTQSASSSLMGKLAGNGGRDEMEVDGPQPFSGRGVKSPSTQGTRTRKRGRAI